MSKLEKLAGLREKAHCKDNYPSHTLLKSVKELPVDIKMHCMSKIRRLLNSR